MADPKATRKHTLRLKITPEMYAAIEQMGNACGMAGNKTVDRFAAELLEVAVVEAYEKRFRKRVAGTISLDDTTEPEHDQEEETEDEQ